jgi:hypothetical protein
MRFARVRGRKFGPNARLNSVEKLILDAAPGFEDGGFAFVQHHPGQDNPSG